MKGKIVVSKFWTLVFSLGKAQAVTVFPFIFMRRELYRHNQVLVNHERIHIRQALETLIVPFYLWYFVEFIVRLIQYRKFHRAYLNISFEREAYSNDNNLAFLEKRKFWNFWKYI